MVNRMPRNGVGRSSTTCKAPAKAHDPKFWALEALANLWCFPQTLAEPTKKLQIKFSAADFGVSKPTPEQDCLPNDLDGHGPWAYRETVYMFYSLLMTANIQYISRVCGAWFRNRKTRATNEPECSRVKHFCETSYFNNSLVHFSPVTVPV